MSLYAHKFDFHLRCSSSGFRSHHTKWMRAISATQNKNTFLRLTFDIFGKQKRITEQATDILRDIFHRKILSKAKNVGLSIFRYQKTTHSASLSDSGIDEGLLSVYVLNNVFFSSWFWFFRPLLKIFTHSTFSRTAAACDPLSPKPLHIFLFHFFRTHFAIRLRASGFGSIGPIRDCQCACVCFVVWMPDRFISRFCCCCCCHFVISFTTHFVWHKYYLSHEG